MKQVFLSLFLVVLISAAFGQDDYRKRPSLGISIIGNDFRTAAEVKANGISKVIRANRYFRDARILPGLAINYMDGLSKHIDFKGSVAGSFHDYPVPNKPIVTGRPLVLEASGVLNFKLLSDNFIVNPYATLGAGVSKVKGYFGAFIPAGVGVQFKLSEDVFILLGSQYRISITDNAAYHFQHSLGIAGALFKKKAVEPMVIPEPAVEVPKDRDGDGIIDTDDQCPDVAGSAALKGCPDKDGDGITDSNDKCPDVAGTAKYGGCPIPDSDKDGINDEEDRCINVAGVARYQGCPVPDGDGDGVNDEEDKCPAVAGPRENSGCPVIQQTIIDKVNYAARNVFFATGSSKLLAKSNKSLDAVVKILKDDTSLMLDIEGHTDITGSAEKNQVLSSDRANSVKNYIVSKGIDANRLNATGYGPDKPVADNKTAAGRAKNRRVEMKVRNY